MCSEIYGNDITIVERHCTTNIFTFDEIQHCESTLYCYSWRTNFRGFRGSGNPRNKRFNELQNFHNIFLCQVWKPRIKEPTNQRIFLKLRQLATTNESAFTVYIFNLKIMLIIKIIAVYHK